MTDTSLSKQLGADSIGEILALSLAGLFALGWVVDHTGLISQRIILWMLDHHVIVAASTHPLCPLPGFGGAGLDRARAIILLGLIICSLAPVVGFAHSRRTHRQHEG